MRSELALISMMGQELTSSLEFKGIKEIMKLIYEQVCDFMDTTLLALGLYDEDNKELKMQYYLGQEQWEARTLNIKENKSLFAWSINNRKEIIIRNLNKEYSLYSKDISKEELARKDINSFICVPLVIGAKVIGILSIQSKNLIAYSDYQMEMFKALSSFVAITLENADLYNEVKVMAITDPLTGIFNRRHFLNLANRELSIYKRYGQNFSLVMVDIDHFKMVNDQYGHDNGDVVLKEVSSYLARSLEATDILCRYGGEEFIILLTGLSLEKAVKKADKIREGLSNLAIKLNTGEMLSVKASFGVSEVLKEDEVLDKVIKRADLALYEAKEKGRNRVCSLAHDVIEEVNISS
jgi:diguanylate cyclase (GGDEF)-like protein